MEINNIKGIIMNSSNEKRIKNIKKVITNEQLLSLITDLCELPKTYFIQGIDSLIELEIKITKNKSRKHAKALFQEKLRKRFSLPTRLKRNQTIIAKNT